MKLGKLIYCRHDRNIIYSYIFTDDKSLNYQSTIIYEFNDIIIN